MKNSCLVIIWFFSKILPSYLFPSYEPFYRMQGIFQRQDNPRIACDYPNSGFLIGFSFMKMACGRKFFFAFPILNQNSPLFIHNNYMEACMPFSFVRLFPCYYATDFFCLRINPGKKNVNFISTRLYLMN